jgi:hypothetical protein
MDHKVVPISFRQLIKALHDVVSKKKRALHDKTWDIDT